MASAETCVLCKDGDCDDPTVVVGEKGLNTLLRFAKMHNDVTIEEDLKSKSSVTVHVICRREYTRPKRKVSDTPMESPKKKRLRSSVSKFLFFCYGVFFFLFFFLQNSFKSNLWVN